jgi:membrane-associated PAP2 superfamily phosphatase
VAFFGQPARCDQRLDAPSSDCCESNGFPRAKNCIKKASMNDSGKLWFLAFILCAGTCGSANWAYAQDGNAALPDSPSQMSRAAKHANDPGSEREVTWRSVPKDFLHDQKAIWLFPTQLGKARYLLPTLAIAGGTAGLIYADPHAMPYFRSHARNLDDINDVFDSSITTGEVAAVPVALMIAGYARHDSYQVSTALLAGEAYADSAIVDLAMKAITRRKRPSDVTATGSFNDTFFSGGQSPFKGSSFPSGHAAAVFSVATVVASRYHNHRWAPWLAYGFATAISCSRITTLAHFPSDVFLGAALGYTITRYGTLGPR